MAGASPLHFDHVGSLLRPKPLFDARQRLLGVHDADHNLGAHDNAELRQLEDEHVAAAVELQEDCGLQLVTDGDFRQRMFGSMPRSSTTSRSAPGGEHTEIWVEGQVIRRMPSSLVPTTGRLTWKS